MSFKVIHHLGITDRATEVLNCQHNNPNEILKNEYSENKPVEKKKQYIYIYIWS